MPEYRRYEEAVQALQRVSAAAHGGSVSDILDWARAAPVPDQAVALFERWITAATNPATWLEVVQENPDLARQYLFLLGASDHLGQVLVQNPELGSILLDDEDHATPFSRTRVSEEIARLLVSARSYSHALDRLRYAKQLWTLRLVRLDLFFLEPQPAIWRMLSELADCLIETALRVSWEDFCAERGLAGPCPISIVAFGKLGGREINYSSDVDLVYIQHDDLSPEIAKNLERFCNKFTKALSDNMGRGALYRVDLRLRPYGGAGSVAVTWRGLEAYYDRYAEDWEILALVRSRMIVGDVERWNELRTRACFHVDRGEWFVENVLRMRRQIEGHADTDDIKRSAGGIRDVEFLAQLLQITNGATQPNLRGRSTVEVLERCIAEQLLTASDGRSLIESYEWLRMLEHRLQIQSNLQSHTLPSDPDRLDCLAVLMNLRSRAEFAQELQFHRDRVRGIWDKYLQTESGEDHAPPLPALAEMWVRSLSEPNVVRAAVQANPLARQILDEVTVHAPVAFELMEGDPVLAEQVLSGEIDEDPVEENISTPIQLRRAVARLLIARARRDPDDLCGPLSDLYRRWVLDRLPAEGIQIVALGSLAAGESTYGSDLDLLLLSSDGADGSEHEATAQEFLRQCHRWRRERAPVEVDLRLRPEGASGALVRSVAAFRKYASREMEPWERMALQRHSLLRASDATALALHEACFGVPLGPATLAELQAIKHRVETERLTGETIWRDAKLGHGGMMDIEWAVQLHVWRASDRGFPVAPGPTGAQIEWLQTKAGVLSHDEAALLAQAHRHHRQVRDRNALLGIQRNLVPENPDKLARLAFSMGAGDPTQWLTDDLALRRSVRSLYEQLLNRLEL